jgi:hypothetical protein
MFGREGFTLDSDWYISLGCNRPTGGQTLMFDVGFVTYETFLSHTCAVCYGVTR